MGNTSSKRADHKLDEARRAGTASMLGDAKRLAKLRGLDNLLWKRFEDTNRCDHTLLDECIKVRREICNLCPCGHPDRALSCEGLAVSLGTRFMQLGDEALLDEAISLLREALSLKPSGCPDRALSCQNLAVSLRTRFQQLGDESLLDEAISLGKEALSLTPSGHPDRARSCRHLAVSLHTRFEKLGDDSLIDEVIYLKREALSLTPRGHPDHADSCQSLAISLQARFEWLGDESLLNEAISLKREALSLTPSSHPDRARSCRNLAVSLGTRFMQLGDESLLDEVISLLREALSLTPSGRPDRARSCQDLAESLRTRFEQFGDESLLDESISLGKEALSLTPSGRPDRALSCQNLAASLHTRFEKLGDESLLDDVISLKREALSLTPSGHPNRASSCHSLAASLVTRFQHLGDESLLDEAISLHKEGLYLTPSGHPNRASSCHSLAVSLGTRFMQFGDESLLDEAISLLREALSLTPSGHLNRASSCRNLAVSLHTRSRQLGDESLLDEAISLHRQALSLTPRGHPDCADSCQKLASSLQTRFEQLRDESLLDEAISLKREALSLTPSDHPNRAYSCQNLAVSLHTRFKQLGDESLLDEAISLKREALSLTPSSHPDHADWCQSLAVSLRTHFRQLGDESSLHESCYLYKESIESRPPHHPLQWRALTALSSMHLNEQTMYSIDLAVDYLCLAVNLNADSLPSLLLAVGHIFTKISPSNVPIHSRDRFLRCLSATLDISSLVVGFILDHQSQLKYLKSCRAIYSSAYFCAALCNQKEYGLELLEHARAMIWSQLLHMREPQLEGIPLDMASELKQLLHGISSSNFLDTSAPSITVEHHATYLTPQDVRYQQNVRINHLVREIRDLPGHMRFMRGLPFKDLARSATNHTVVVLIAGQDECHALILRSTQNILEDICFENIKRVDLEQLSVTLPATRMRGTIPTSTETDDRGMQVARARGPFHQALYKLWIDVVKPVLDYLHLEKAEGLSRPRLHWCPTGPFTFLPLHAAGIYDKGREDCCSEYVVSSYTPTITALIRAQRSMLPINTEASRLTLVAAPTTYKSTLPVLASVREEISHVASIAKQARMSLDESCLQESATVAYTASSLKSSSLAHIACHGIQNPTDALSSGFCLQDGQLTVSQLMELDLKNAFFAFLSACETAKGDADQPDQTVHLAAAMLFVGFRSVVATMWAMGDDDGPKVAKYFYERLFAENRISLDDIPYALDYAVGKLRRSDVPPERWVTFIHMGA